MIKLLLMIITVCLGIGGCCNTCKAESPRYNGIIIERQSINGISRFYQGPKYIGSSRPNVFRGMNYYDSQGRMIYRSVPFGRGYRYYSFGGLR